MADAENRAGRAGRPTPLWWLLVSPLVNLFRPRAAARAVLATPTPALVAFYLVTVPTLIASAGFAALVAPRIIDLYWDFSSARVLEMFTIDGPLAVLAATHVNGAVTALHLVLALALGAALAATFAFAWLHQPLLHSRGPMLPTWRRAVALATVCAWPASVLLLLLPVGLLVLLLPLAYLNQEFPRFFFDPGICLPFLLAVFGVVFLVWTRRATTAAAPPPPDLSDLPPRCEGCGYQLYNPNLDALCTECGRLIRTSLVATEVRPGLVHFGVTASAATRLGLRTWWRLLRPIVISPQRFYARLPLRTGDDAAERFARWTYPLLWLHGAGWLGLATLIAVVNEGGLPNTSDIPTFIAVFLTALTILTLLAWLLHRTLGALIFTAWHLARALPDARWLARCMAYETAWLHVWPLMVGPGLLLLVVFGDPLEASGLIPFEFLLLANFGGLSLLWLAGATLRYERIRQAIRWSNY
ncbi:MAG: hypothetical protein IPM18_05960 [Phycisphaerales bacterium]|nr:hypothetical protein [Phycisphaerales bacterium]